MSCGSGRGHENHEDHEQRSTEADRDEATRILGVRLAKGEITRQEYLDLKELLERQQGSDGAANAGHEGPHENRIDDQPSYSESRRHLRGGLFGGGC